MKRKINVLFYRPPPTDLLLNKVVAYCDPPYSHTEVKKDTLYVCVRARVRLCDIFLCGCICAAVF